jgi:methyl-accepting chemotaxis protein
MQPNGSQNQPTPNQPNAQGQPSPIAKSAATNPPEPSTQRSVPLPPPIKGLSLRGQNQQQQPKAAPIANLPTTEKMLARWSAKAILSALAIGFVPVAGLGGLGYTLLNQSVAQTQANQSQASASQITDRLTQLLSERYRDLQQVVDLQVLQDGRFGAAEKLKALEQQKNQGGYKAIALVDLNGQPKFQPNGSNLENQAQQAYFREAVQSGKPIIGQPQADKGGTVLPIAVPVMDAANTKATAVLVAHLNVETIVSFTNTTAPDGSESTDRVYFTDTKGKVVIANNAAAVNQEIETQVPGSQAKIAELSVGQSITHRLKFGLSAIGFTDKSQPDHIIGLASTSSLKGITMNPLRTVVVADLEQVLSLQRQRSMQFGFAMLSLLGVVGIAALMMAKQTTKLVNDQVETLEDQYRSLQARQQRSVERSQWLGQMIETMRQSMGESALLNTTVTELRYALNTDRVMFYRCNDDWSGTIIAEAVSPNYRKFMGQTIHDLFREGSVDRYQDGQVQVIPDVTRLGLTRGHKENLEKLQIKASLIAPILQHGKLVGLLCAHQCSDIRQWEEEDVSLFAKLSSQLGFVLEQSALIHRQAQSVEKSRILNEIVDSMRRSFKEEDILNTTVNELRYTLNADRVVVYRLDRDGKALIIAESVALTYPKLHGKIIDRPFPLGVMERYRLGQVWSMPDIDAEGLPPEYRELLDEFQVRSSVVAPIIQNGELLGLLAVHACQEPQQWQPEDIGLVANLGRQLGLALNQAAILRRQTLSAERLRTLNEIVSAMRRSLKDTDILTTAVNELRLVLNTDRVILYRFPNQATGSETGTIVAESAGLALEKLLGRNIPHLFQDIPLERLKNGHVRSVNDIYQEKLTIEHLELLEDLQIRASIAAPVMQNGELIGLLAAQECKGTRQWEAQDLDLFAKLAIQLGYALDQAEFIAATERASQVARQEADATVAEQRKQQEFFRERARELLNQVEPVTRGDLTVQARVSSDEVGEIAKSYNDIIATLRQTIADVQEASKSVTSKASNSENALNALSQETQQQMQTVAQALQQVQELVIAHQKIGERAKQAEANVSLATQTLQLGDEAMDRTVLGMSSIREAVAETAKKVKRLGEASQKISRVVNLINGFATQTNLLAMNASIEAAKAGEEGQGFAVVAEEVRTLAQQSAAATAEIEQVVEEIQRQTNEVVASMESGTEQVVNGTQLVEDSRSQLNQIAEVSMQIHYLIRDISQGVSGQTENSAVVRQTVQQVAQMLNNTSNQTQHVADSFAQLIQMAADLQSSTAQFKVRHDRK